MCNPVTDAVCHLTRARHGLDIVDGVFRRSAVQKPRRALETLRQADINIPKATAPPAVQP